jgi:hypothetical protein
MEWALVASAAGIMPRTRMAPPLALSGLVA